MDGKKLTKTIYLCQPITMNGNKIYSESETTTPPGDVIIHLPGEKSRMNNSRQHSLAEYLLNNIIKDTLPASFSGYTMRVELRDLVVDEKGNIVYYYFDGIKCTGPDGQIRTMKYYPAKIDALLASVHYLKPATLNGNKATVRLNPTLPYYKLEVKNHVVTYKWDGKSEL